MKAFRPPLDHTLFLFGPEIESVERPGELAPAPRPPVRMPGKVPRAEIAVQPRAAAAL